jgi:hypothetical protein
MVCGSRIKVAKRQLLETEPRMATIPGELVKNAQRVKARDLLLNETCTVTNDVAMGGSPWKCFSSSSCLPMGGHDF